MLNMRHKEIKHATEKRDTSSTVTAQRVDLKEIENKPLIKRQMGAILFKNLFQLLSMMIVKCVYDNNKLNNEDTMDERAKFISQKIKLLGSDFDEYLKLSFPKMLHTARDPSENMKVYQQQTIFLDNFKGQQMFTNLQIQNKINSLFNKLTTIPEFSNSEITIETFITKMSNEYGKSGNSSTVENFIESKRLYLLEFTQTEIEFLETIELYPNELFIAISSVSNIKSSVKNFSEMLNLTFNNDIKNTLEDFKPRIKTIQDTEKRISSDMEKTKEELKRFKIQFTFDAYNLQIFRVLKLRLSTECLKKYEDAYFNAINCKIQKDKCEKIQFLNENLNQAIIAIVGGCEDYINEALYEYLQKCRTYAKNLNALNDQCGTDGSSQTDANMSFNFNRAPFASAIPTVFRLCSFKV